MKRRSINVFSLSFLDCICCGLGAIILLFVIVNAQSEARRDRLTVDLRGEVERLEKEVLEGKKGLARVRNAMEETDREVVQTEGLSSRLTRLIEKTLEELAEYRDRTLASKDHVKKLKADLKSLEQDLRRLKAGALTPDRDGKRLRRFPGQGDRHYLTDLKVGGKRIVFLVDASASMLAESVVGVVRRRNLKPGEKIRSPKWQRLLATVDWLVTRIPATSRFQMLAFNETVKPVTVGTAAAWLDAGDPEVLNRVMAKLNRLVPQKGTSLINAIDALGSMKPLPDNVFLLTDSLPTMGAKPPWRNRVSGKKRKKLFQAAVDRLPRHLPVNIILFPMEGDPLAASAYWRLATASRGSFFCPSPDWP